MRDELQAVDQTMRRAIRWLVALALVIGTPLLVWIAVTKFLEVFPIFG